MRHRCRSTNDWNSEEGFDPREFQNWWRAQTGAPKIILGLLFLVISRFVLRMLAEEETDQ